jgi:lipopolysaccharide exporter
MNLTRRAAAGVRWTAFAGVVTVCAESLRNIIFARYLYPIDFGLMAMVLVIIGLAQMYTDMGISSAIIHRQDSTKEELSSLYWLTVASGWLVFVLTWSSAPLIAWFYHESRLVPLLKAVSFVFVVLPFTSQFEILLQRDLAFDYLAKRDVYASVGQLLISSAWDVGAYQFVNTRPLPATALIVVVQ